MYINVTIRNKNDPEKVFSGFILWHTKHRFCLEVGQYYDEYVLWYKDWEFVDYGGNLVDY